MKKGCTLGAQTKHEQHGHEHSPLPFIRLVDQSNTNYRRRSMEAIEELFIERIYGNISAEYFFSDVILQYLDLCMAM